MMHLGDSTVLGQQALVPFAEYRPETVSVDTWVEYVRLMTAAGYGQLTPPGVARLDAIYDQAPEIIAAGRDLDFAPGWIR